MKRHITTLSWPAGVAGGLKRTIIAAEQEVDLINARHQYAQARGFTLLAERADGLVALYWDENDRLIRLAIEPVETL